MFIWTAAMIIGLIEGDRSQQDSLKQKLATQQVFSSELARMEARLLAIRKNDQNSLQRFDSFFSVCTMIPLEREVFEKATLLRTEHQIKTPDALHLSAAVCAGCDEFWTNDRQLVSVAGRYLRVLDWDALDEHL